MNSIVRVLEELAKTGPICSLEVQSAAISPTKPYKLIITFPTYLISPFV